MVILATLLYGNYKNNWQFGAYFKGSVSDALLKAGIFIPHILYDLYYCMFLIG